MPRVGWHTYESDNLAVGNLGSWTSSTNGTTIATTNLFTAHHGRYIAYIQGMQLANEFAWSTFAPAPTTYSLLYARHYTLLETVPNTGAIFLQSSYAAATIALFGYDTATSKWGIYNNHTATQYAEAGTSVLPAMTWLCIESLTLRSATVGILALWINRMPKVYQTGIDTGDNDMTAYTFGGYLSAANAAARNVRVDDAVVAQERIGCELCFLPQTPLDNRPHQLGRVMQYS